MYSQGVFTVGGFALGVYTLRGIHFGDLESEVYTLEGHTLGVRATDVGSGRALTGDLHSRQLALWGSTLSGSTKGA